MKNPGLNPLAAVSKLWQFCLLHTATVQPAVNEYLATDSGGYVNKVLAQ